MKGALRSSLMAMARVFLDQVIVRRMHRNVPDWAFDRIRGMCDVSGRSMSEMSVALILPDLMPLFEVWLAKFAPHLFVPVEFPPLFGCSSFFARGDRFLFGRNLDFPGVGYWDRYPVVQVTEPERRLRYIAFTTAGVPFGGITGVNEDRLAVALHQHYSRAGNLGGKLPFLIAEHILMHARTIEEALEFLGRQKVATSWAFLIADGKSRQAVIYEAHSKAQSANRLTGQNLAHANFYQTSQCRAHELATSARMNWDNYCRKERLEELLTEAGNGLAPERAVKILSDHFDPYWNEEKPFNRTVSQVYNIQSVLFDLEKMTAWMAEGDAPVHLRNYVELDLGALFAGKTGRTGKILEGYRFQSEQKREAKECFIRSFIHAFDGKYDLAETWLRHSLEACYLAEPALIWGVLRLKAGDFAGARAIFLEARAFLERKRKDKFPPEYFEILIYLARTHDLLGERELALALYSEVEKHEECGDLNLKRIAQAKKKYEARHLGRIVMPYSSYVPFH